MRMCLSNAVQNKKKKNTKKKKEPSKIKMEAQQHIDQANSK